MRLRLQWMTRALGAFAVCAPPAPVLTLVCLLKTHTDISGLCTDSFPGWHIPAEGNATMILLATTQFSVDAGRCESSWSLRSPIMPSSLACTSKLDSWVGFGFDW